MRPRTDAQSARRFYYALTALLFAAVCAWLGSALFGALTALAAKPAEPPPAAGRIRGILLRRELVLAPAEIPAGAEDGKRLSAGDTGGAAGLFLRGTDGLEYLTPGDAAALTPAGLDALLASPPETADAEAGRLLPDFEVWCAAFCEGGAPAKGACRAVFRGAEGAFEGRVVSVSTDGQGRAALLIRFPAGPEALYRLRRVTGELTMLSQRGL